MTTAYIPVSHPQAGAQEQGAFLTLLSALETHARIFFRHIACAETRADMIAETVALAWRWYVRLQQRGKDITKFRMVFISLVARAVKSGRRVCGQQKTKDVLSERAQRLHGFKVERLPCLTRRPLKSLYTLPQGQGMNDALEECLQDNTQTPVPDQAAFRIDFPAWLDTLTPRERRFIREMVKGERTKDLSKRFELSLGRISQLRRAFETGWRQFCGDYLTDASSVA